MAIPSWRAICIQMPSELAAKAETQAQARAIIGRNLDVAVQAITQACAAHEPPQLVVLPEFGLQGPPHHHDIASWLELACGEIPGPMTAPLQALAKARGIFIAGNLFERDPRWPGRFFNSCFLIDDQGEVILRFRRINTAMWPSPHDFMDDYFAEYGVEGTFPVVETRLGRLAMVACGEIAVPEVLRALMMRGAEVLLHPTNEALAPAQEAAKIARAAENMMYVVSANVAGGIGFSYDGSVPGGRSRIVDFRGETLAFEPGAQPSTEVAAKIDVEALRAARRDLGLGNTLLRSRWEIYRGLFASASFYPPNQFLQAPMANVAATRPVAEAALQNLIDAGISQR